MSHKRAAIAEQQALVSQQHADATQTTKPPQSRLVFSELIDSPLLTAMTLTLRDAIRAESGGASISRLAALTEAAVQGKTAAGPLIELDQLIGVGSLLRCVQASLTSCKIGPSIRGQISN